MQKTLKILLLLLIIFLPQISWAKGNDFNQSFSVQIGLNGVASDANSYELQFIPPDLSYSYELFDNDKINISTSSFYDNIGVKTNGKNFSYRLGQRFDFGFEIEKYTPYLTAGIGVIRRNHSYQSSLIYGAGILKRISDRISWVNEINFQKVRVQNSHELIVNISTGITYSF